MPISQLEAATMAIDASMGASWEANMVQAATITPQPINWLWPTWLATGKLTILAGAAGTGKTTLALGLAATLTSAGFWPDGQRMASPGNVIIWSSEDDPADTLIPRLMAMGADLKRVYMIQGKINDQGEREPFDPASDMDLLKLAAARMGGVALLMIDPIVSAIKGDMHKANEVRRGLQAIVDFAAEQKAAIIGISHFAKGTKGCDPQERVIGSQAFAALARMVLVAAKQEDSDMRVLARAKSNIAIDDGGIEYGIQAATLDNGIETTRAYWGGKIEGCAREILGAVEHTEPAAGNSEIDDAE
ncbi:MAG: AAA family ATPase, partial [Castellaniella sp.]